MASDRRDPVALWMASALLAGLAGLGLGRFASSLPGEGEEGLAAWSGSTGRSGSEASLGSPHRSVLLVTLEGLRASAVESFGGAPGLTPVIDGAARRGVRFTRALAPSSAAAESIGGLILGVPVGDGPDGEPNGGRAVAQVLREAGYRCAAVVAGPSVPPGAEGSFHRFLRVEPADSEALVASVRDTAGELAGRGPWFLWVHLAQPGLHFAPEKMRPPAQLGAGGSGLEAAQARALLEELGREPLDALPARRRAELRGLLRGAYAAEVRAADRTVGEVFAAVPGSAEAIVAITSAQGLALGEGGHVGSGKSVQLAEIHVPLVVVGPPDQPAGLVVPTAVSLAEVGPTLLALSGVGSDGRSLVRRGRLGLVGAHPVVSVLHSDAGRQASLVIDRLRLVATPGEPPRLFDDLAELGRGSDLAGSRPTDVAWMLRRLEAELASLGPP